MRPILPLSARSWQVFLFLLLLACGHQAAAQRPPADGPGYSFYSAGDPSASRPGRTGFGLLLMGGGGWDAETLRWFADRAGHGHLLILRASGDGTDGIDLLRRMSLKSARTIVFSSRAAAFQPRVLALVEAADAILIAGGDQANYVGFWADTPLARALARHVARGRPLAGTSAGLAIMGGGVYGALDGGSIASTDALADPFGPAVTMVRDVLRLPFLEHAVTDSHFMARDRLGRLIAFVVNQRAGADPRAFGLGIDERTALAIDRDGIGRVLGANGGAWLVNIEGPAASPNSRPLDQREVSIIELGPGSSFSLPTGMVANPATVLRARVAGGRLIVERDELREMEASAAAEAWRQREAKR